MHNNSVENNSVAGKETPGILGRFVLRNTPVPILVREYLADHPEFEFTEDYNLPANFAGIPGLPEPQRTSFFLRDRAVIRLGVIRRRGDGDPDARQDRAFTASVRDELLRCGKNPADFIVLPFAADDPQNRDVFRGRAAATIIWLQERTTLENLIGGGEKAELPPKLVMRATELLPPMGVVDHAYGDSPRTRAAVTPAGDTAGTGGLVVPIASGDSAAPAEPEPMRADASTKNAWLELPPAVPEPEIEPEIKREPPEWRDWTEFRYGVSGNARGQLRRRMLIRHTGGFLRAIMLAAEKQPSAEYLARFFEQIGEAADPVRTHREWLGREARENTAAEFGDIASISFALNKDGRFISAGREIRPVLWRAAKKQLVVFPITRAASVVADESEENPYRLVRGTLNPGDRLLLTPGRFASHELRELFDIFKLDDDDEVRVRLDNYLDYRASGKALLLVRPGPCAPAE